MTNRRDFLGTVGALALAGCVPTGQPPLPPGELLGARHDVGHRLREGGFPEPSTTLKARVAIIGAGVAGLSAAWALRRAGWEDLRILELEPEPGGNSRGGRSDLVAYPWGAHYLPLPPPEAKATRLLLAELGVLQGDPLAQRPIYDERYLCATPQERVFRDGLWHEGLLPRRGVPAAERDQQRRFQEHMEFLKQARGSDGRWVFALPMAASSQDAAWLALDGISFRQWLTDNGYTAPTVHWLANYACRDDYGTAYDQTSAWAGLHYFACRRGEAANAATDAVLTAPEGNGWLVKGLAAGLGERLQCGALVWRIAETPRGVVIDNWSPASGASSRLEAEQVIWAAPMFLLPRVWPGLPASIARAAAAGDYAPWLVANLHLADFPQERHGAPAAWDNVFYDSAGLGYVVATHQLIRRHLPGTVFTYYRALHEVAPAEGRRLLLETPREAWAEGILGELERVHPDIRRLVTRLDVFRHGHAMRRPLPGKIWGPERRLLADFATPRLKLAHADQSGFSIFEEAQYRGVAAAERVLAGAGRRFEPLS